MSVKRLAVGCFTGAIVAFAIYGGASAQSSGGGSSGGGSSGGGAAGSQSPGGGDVTSGRPGMGGRLGPAEAGVPGGPAGEKRVPETKSRYVTCPDGSRGDLNAGGCLGGGR